MKPTTRCPTTPRRPPQGRARRRRHAVRHACAIIQAAGDFEMFPTLLKTAENKKHKHAADVLATIASLTDVLYQDLAQWAGSAAHRRTRPVLYRRHVLVALEQSLGRFAQHQRLKSSTLSFCSHRPITPRSLKILRDTHHACHAPMVAALATSEDSGIMERLVELLRDTDAPTAALEVVAQRGDQQFLNILLHELKHPAPLRVLHNMKRLRHVVWLESRREMLLELDGRASRCGRSRRRERHQQRSIVRPARTGASRRAGRRPPCKLPGACPIRRSKGGRSRSSCRP